MDGYDSGDGWHEDNVTTGVSIRAATLADVSAMAAILASGDEPIDWPDLPGWPYLEHLVTRATTSVAIGVEGTVIGFGGAIEVGTPERPNVRWLTDLFVDPAHHEHGAGHAILDEVLRDSVERMTASSADQRALGLYIRTGMRPWWPFLYLAGDVARLPPLDEAIEIDAADVAQTATFAKTWTGRDHAPDFAHYATLPGSAGFAVRDSGGIAAVGWARRERHAAGRWLDHVSIAPDADPVRAVLAAWHAAAPDGGRVRGVVPGPHPAVGRMLESGIRILDRDTFCATDPGLLDPVRILPNPGFL